MPLAWVQVDAKNIKDDKVADKVAETKPAAEKCDKINPNDVKSNGDFDNKAPEAKSIITPEYASNKFL